MNRSIKLYTLSIVLLLIISPVLKAEEATRENAPTHIVRVDMGTMTMMNLMNLMPVASIEYVYRSSNKIGFQTILLGGWPLITNGQPLLGLGVGMEFSSASKPRPDGFVFSLQALALLSDVNFITWDMALIPLVRCDFGYQKVFPEGFNFLVAGGLGFSMGLLPVFPSFKFCVGRAF